MSQSLFNQGRDFEQLFSALMWHWKPKMSQSLFNQGRDFERILEEKGRGAGVYLSVAIPF